jgi:maleate isomerase
MTYDRSLAPLARLEHQLAFVPRAVQDLVTADVDVVAYGCTSGSFIHGQAWETAYVAELETAAGRPVVLTARALAEAARSEGIDRPAVVTPYRQEINERLLAYLESWDFAIATLIELEGSPPERIPPGDVVRALESAPRAGQDGYVIACTALRAWEAAEAVAPTLGVPVVTSNQAALRAAVDRAMEVAAGG